MPQRRTARRQSYHYALLLDVDLLVVLGRLSMKSI